MGNPAGGQPTTSSSQPKARSGATGFGGLDAQRMQPRRAPGAGGDARGTGDQKQRRAPKRGQGKTRGPKGRGKRGGPGAQKRGVSRGLRAKPPARAEGARGKGRLAAGFQGGPGRAPGAGDGGHTRGASGAKREGGGAGEKGPGAFLARGRGGPPGAGGRNPGRERGETSNCSKVSPKGFSKVPKEKRWETPRFFLQTRGKGKERGLGKRPGEIWGLRPQKTENPGKGPHPGNSLGPREGKKERFLGDFLEKRFLKPF